MGKADDRASLVVKADAVRVDRVPLVAKLATIMGAIPNIEKRGKISADSGPKYNFVRDPDVLAKIRPLMADAGIMMIPETMERMEPRVIARDGRQPNVVESVRVNWRVTDGVEELRFQSFGQGSDTGDKALAKAQTLARKYAFMQLYHLVTGHDPDEVASDSSPARSQARSGRPVSSQGQAAPTSEAITAQDWRRIFAKAKENGYIDRAQVAEVAAGIAGWDGIDGHSLSELSVEQVRELEVRIGKPVELDDEAGLPGDPGYGG